MTLMEVAEEQLELPFSDEERAHLARCEAVIEAGLKTFYQVGTALVTIREQRLYRETHRSFEAYCRDRWAMSIAYANRLIGAAEVILNLETAPIGATLPQNEAQARELAGLSPEQQREAWQQVVEKNPDGKITAKSVHEVVQTFAAPKAEEPAPALSGETGPPQSGPWAREEWFFMVVAGQEYSVLYQCQRRGPCFIFTGESLPDGRQYYGLEWPQLPARFASPRDLAVHLLGEWAENRRRPQEEQPSTSPTDPLQNFMEGAEEAQAVETDTNQPQEAPAGGMPVVAVDRDTLTRLWLSNSCDGVRRGSIKPPVLIPPHLYIAVGTEDGPEEKSVCAYRLVEAEFFDGVIQEEVRSTPEGLDYGGLRVTCGGDAYVLVGPRIRFVTRPGVESAPPAPTTKPQTEAESGEEVVPADLLGMVILNALGEVDGSIERWQRYLPDAEFTGGAAAQVLLVVGALARRIVELEGGALVLSPRHRRLVDALIGRKLPHTELPLYDSPRGYLEMLIERQADIAGITLEAE